MSSFMAKMLFTVVTVAISGLAAYFLSTQAQSQANQPHGAPRRRRRSSTPPPPSTNRGWYGPADEDEDIVESIESAHTGGSSEKDTNTSKSSTSACSICLEKYDEIRRKGRDIHSTLCGHIFCEICIRRATRRNPFCPQCRKSCPPGSTHVIYI